MLQLNIFVNVFSRSALWYPEAGLHYPVPGYAYHYLLGPERAVHNRERTFHDNETEAGFLQVSENELKTDLRISLLGESLAKNKGKRHILYNISPDV